MFHLTFVPFFSVMWKHVGGSPNPKSNHPKLDILLLRSMVLGYLHFRKPPCLSATAGQTFVLLDGCQVTSTRNGPRLRSGEFKRLGKWKMSMPSANWGLVGFPDGWPGFEMNQQAGAWWSENHRKPWTIMNNNDHEIPTSEWKQPLKYRCGQWSTI